MVSQSSIEYTVYTGITRYIAIALASQRSLPQISVHTIVLSLLYNKWHVPSPWSLILLVKLKFFTATTANFLDKNVFFKCSSLCLIKGHGTPEKP